MFGAVVTASSTRMTRPHDPRLPPDLGRRPSPPRGRRRERAGRHGRPGNHRDAGGAGVRHHATANQAPRTSSPCRCRPSAGRRSARRPTGGRSSGGTSSRPCTSASGSWWASSDRPVGDLDAVADPPVDVDAADRQRRAALGLVEALERGELDRLVLGEEAGRPVADADLHRGDGRRHREGEQEAEPVVAVRRPRSHPAA